MPPKYKRGKYNKKSKRNNKKYSWKMKKKSKVPLSLQQHQFVERAAGEQITIGNEAGGVDTAPFYSKVFKFKDLKQCDAYSNIFEQYRLDKIVATFRYKGVSTPAQLASGNAYVNEINPILYFKVDHNDVNTNTLATMKVSSRTKTHVFTNSNSEFSITLKPAAQVLLLRSLTQPGNVLNATNVPKWKQWIDADGLQGPGSDAEHFGLKCYACAYKDTTAVAPLPKIDPGSIDIEYKYYFSMKSNE